MFDVLRAEFVARKAHKGQIDKAGVKYINHPKAVAKGVKGKKEKVVAWLHDTVEDTWVTNDYIRSHFGDEIADAVECLTHRDGEDYMSYVSRVKSNKIACAVKMSDLRHNMDLSRLSCVTDKDLKRIEKYKKAYAYLEK